MTLDEAIAKLKNFADHCYPNEEFLIAIKALEQKPHGDLISRETVLDAFSDYVGSGMSMNDFDALWDIVVKTQSVNPQEPKTGHWILTDDDFVYCSECEDSYYPRPIDASWNYCPHCGCRMVEQESEETETWNGIHAQITAPKGTFERIFNEADDDNDI
jgi:hypothetical protein